MNTDCRKTHTVCHKRPRKNSIEQEPEQHKRKRKTQERNIDRTVNATHTRVRTRLVQSQKRPATESP